MASLVDTLPKWAALVMVAPIAALFSSCFTLYQFSKLYTNLSVYSQKPAGKNPVWNTIRPFLKTIVRSLNFTLGDADKFLGKIQPTHVLLGAILLVLIIWLEMIREQLSRPRPSKSSASRS